MNQKNQASVASEAAVRVLLAAATLLLGGASGQAQLTKEQLEKRPKLSRALFNPPKNGPVKPFRVMGNIHYVGMTNASAFLITTPQGHILLDTMYDQTVPQLRQSIEGLGFQIKDIKYILQAHAHGDHVGGLAAMKELTGAQVLVMAQDAETLADGGKSDFRPGESWKPIRADKTLRDGEKVQLGGVTMTAHLTAGHTRGCTTWTTQAEEDGRKYNVVFLCSMRPNEGLPLVGNPKYPNMVEDFTAAFKKLKAMPVDVFLASHAFMFNMEEKRKRQEAGEKPNPFIDPAGFKAHVDGYDKGFEEMVKYERLVGGK